MKQYFFVLDYILEYLSIIRNLGGTAAINSSITNFELSYVIFLICFQLFNYISFL